MRIRSVLTCGSLILSRKLILEAQRDYMFKFLRENKNIVKLRQSILDFCHVIRTTQSRFKSRYVYVQARFKYLRQYWKNEWELYRFEMAMVPNDEENKAKYIANKHFLKLMDTYD